MKKIILICFLSISSIFSQSNFWGHYCFTQNIQQIIESSDGTIYVITDSALIRSSDQYQTWDVLYEFEHPLDSDHLFDIYMNYSSQNTIKLVTRYRTHNPSSETIKLTTDNGNSWNSIDYPGGYSKSIAINSTGDIYLLSDTLYKSADDGLSWNPINIPTDDYELGYVLIIDNNDNIYIARYKRFWILDLGSFRISNIYLARRKNISL